MLRKCGCLYRRKNKPKSSDDADDADKNAHLPQQPRVDYNASNQAVSVPSYNPANIYVVGDSNYSRLQPSVDKYTGQYEVLSELPLAANSPIDPTYVPLEISHRPLPQPPDSGADLKMLDSDGYLDLH